MTSLLLRSICCSAPRFYSSSSSSYRSTNPLKSSLLHRIPGLTRHFSAAKDSAASRCRSCNPTLTIPSEVFYLSCIDPLKCDPVVQRFEQWLSRYGRNYKDKTEWYYRFGIYQSNLDFINGYNSENKSSKLVDNQFADMTNDEFRADYCGLRVPNQLKRYNLMHKMTTNAPDSAPDSAPNHAPHSVDWRKYGAVTYVKHEEHYGTSWAFAAVATVEGLHMIKTDRLFLLSAQQIIDGYTKNRGCIYGGSVEEAFKYIKVNGLTGEASYLYGRTCKNNKGSKTIASISGHEYVPPNDEKILRDAVAKQPICAMVDSSSMAFRLYESGILKGFGGTNLDHFVTIVGYGGSGNNKYWIAKNSWGKEWGEDGYIRIRRDVKYKEGLLGIAMEASYPLA